MMIYSMLSSGENNDTNARSTQIERFKLEGKDPTSPIRPTILSKRNCTLLPQIEIFFGADDEQYFMTQRGTHPGIRIAYKQ